MVWYGTVRCGMVWYGMACMFIVVYIKNIRNTPHSGWDTLAPPRKLALPIHFPDDHLVLAKQVSSNFHIFTQGLDKIDEPTSMNRMTPYNLGFQHFVNKCTRDGILHYIVALFFSSTKPHKLPQVYLKSITGEESGSKVWIGLTGFSAVSRCASSPHDIREIREIREPGGGVHAAPVSDRSVAEEQKLQSFGEFHSCHCTPFVSWMKFCHFSQPLKTSITMTMMDA